MQNDYQPSGREQQAIWDEHKKMLESHKEIKQARRELHKRTQGKKLKYAGNLY